MTMQPEQLKALRKGARMTLAEMAEAIGMSLDSVGRMERGVPGYPIEKRTALAVEYVVAQRMARLDGAEEREGDIPLAEAQINWADPEDDLDPPVVVSSLERPGQGLGRYSNSNGACTDHWQNGSTLSRLANLFMIVQHMTLVDKVDPRAAHDALIVIPEYRAMMPPDPALGLGREEVDG